MKSATRHPQGGRQKSASQQASRRRKNRTDKTRSRIHLIIADVPTSRRREIAGLLAERHYWDMLHLTEIALSIH
ncbi:hypothetical protein [Pyrobaculum ferrireducens]|uniref:hypothetical protein n=1 Tax=Pyrobaculum ferrireducens TaxID=1104324 RepID=UPI0011E56752|nr:hypothetical protein [Pyrobaculum ferrireducens]